MEIITLWSNSEGPFRDEHIFEDDHILIVNYCGQRNVKGNRDHLIPNAHYYVGGKEQARKYIGKVLHVTEIARGTDTRRFHITIQKSNDETLYRLKKDFCNAYHLTTNDLMPGITKHIKMDVDLLY